MTSFHSEKKERPMKDSLLAIYDNNFDLAQRLVADIEGEALVVQPAPRMNHAAWVIGHLAQTCDVAMWVIGADDVAPSGWRDLFGPHTTPQADASLYPDKKTLLGGLSEGHERVAEQVRHLSEEQWAAPPTMDRLAKRWPTRREALLHVMVGHEQMHLGQVSAWRRAQGLPAV